MPRALTAGATTNKNAITVENKAGFNGASGPDFSVASVRAAWRFHLPHNPRRRVTVYVDVFNVTKPLNNPSSDQRTTDTFLILRPIRNAGPSRTAQLNIRHDF